MSWIKKLWADGQKVAGADANNIEEGIQEAKNTAGAALPKPTEAARPTTLEGVINILHENGFCK